MEEHNRNFLSTIQRVEERELNLKLDKSMFCTPEVKWFRRQFIAAVDSMDLDKLSQII